MFLYYFGKRALGEALKRDGVGGQIQNLNGANLELALRTVGLSHLIGQPLTKRGVERDGPDGDSGWIVSRNCAGQPENYAVGYFPDAQAWYRNPDADYFVGVYPEQLPRPDVLELDVDVECDSMVLEDGNSWKAPIALYLPRRYGLSPEGEQILKAVPKYAEFSAAATAFMEHVEGLKASVADGGGFEIDAEIVNAVVDSGFRCIYGIGLFETMVLELFQTGYGSRGRVKYALKSAGYDVLRAASGVMDEEKKTGSEVDLNSSNIDSGATDTESSRPVGTSCSTGEGLDE